MSKPSSSASLFFADFLHTPVPPARSFLFRYTMQQRLSPLRRNAAAFFAVARILFWKVFASPPPRERGEKKRGLCGRQKIIGLARGRKAKKHPICSIFYAIIWARIKHSPLALISSRCCGRHIHDWLISRECVKNALWCIYPAHSF